jgi:hypothetical protein
MEVFWQYQVCLDTGDQDLLKALIGRKVLPGPSQHLTNMK